MALTLSGTNGIVGAGFTVDNSGVSVTAGVGTFSSLNAAASGLTGALPALDAASLTSINAAQLVGICTSGLTKTGGFGKILQVVHTFKQDAFTTSSSSPVEITGLNASITKTSASNKLLITVDLGYGKSGRDQMVCNLYEDSSELTAANGTGGSTDNLFIFDYTHLPATDNETISMRNVSKTVLVDGVSDTSSHTYKVYASASAATFYLNRRGSGTTYSTTSSITIMEVAV